MSHAESDREESLEADAVGPPGLFERLTMPFHSPAALFERLRAHPRWAATLVICAALIVLSFVLVPTEVWEGAVREQFLRSDRDVPEGFTVQGAWFRTAGMVAGTVFFFLWAFVLAGLYFIVFAFLLGDDVRYVQYLSVVSHAFVIGAVGALLLVPLRVAQADPQLTLNLSVFAFGLDPGSYPFRVLRLLDIFSLWSFVVAAVGISVMDPHRSFRSAATVLLTFALGFALVVGAFVPA